MTGIYKITNKLNDKSYIGQSVHCGKRLDEHYRGSQFIDEIIQMEGINNFSFEILKEVSREELSYWEDYYIIKYNTMFPNGYNKKWNCKKDIRNDIKKEIDLEILSVKAKKKPLFSDLCTVYSVKIAHLYDYCIGLLYTYDKRLEEMNIQLSDLSNYIEESKEKTKNYLRILKNDGCLNVIVDDDDVKFIDIKDYYHQKFIDSKMGV